MTEYIVQSLHGFATKNKEGELGWNSDIEVAYRFDGEQEARAIAQYIFGGVVIQANERRKKERTS